MRREVIVRRQKRVGTPLSILTIEEERQMKKMFLVLFMILALTGIAFADQPSGGGDATATATATQSQGIGSGNILNGQGGTISILSPSATGGVGGAGGAGGSVTIEEGAIKNVNKVRIDNTDVNVNVNRPVNINKNVIEEGAVKNYNTNKQNQRQGQSQGQDQGQSQSNAFTPTNVQGQNNDQVVAPEQTVIIKSPVQLPNIPSSSVPELNFGNGRMYDTTKTLPNFAIFGIRSLGGNDMIMEVLNVNANVKFKNLYKAILSDAKDVANGGKKTLVNVRYQVIRAEAQKSWHTGGSLGGGGSGVSTTGLSGGAGAGSIVPSFGGTKADDLFTIIFVQVQEFKN